MCVKINNLHLNYKSTLKFLNWIQIAWRYNSKNVTFPRRNYVSFAPSYAQAKALKWTNYFVENRFNCAVIIREVQRNWRIRKRIPLEKKKPLWNYSFEYLFSDTSKRDGFGSYLNQVSVIRRFPFCWIFISLSQFTIIWNRIFLSN